MGTGISDRYGKTWGARRLSGEVVPGSAEAMRSAALLGLAAARAGLTEDELLSRVAFESGADPRALKQAMFGAVPLPGVALPELGGLLEALLEGLVGVLGISVLMELLLSLADRVLHAESATEGEAAKERTDDDRRPGIYENCIYAEVTTGEVFYRGNPHGGHFGVPKKQNRVKEDGETFGIHGCGDAVERRAKALFDALSRGSKLHLDLVQRGIVMKLRDETFVSYRWITKTAGSPAVSIGSSADPRVMNHKVHFKP